MHSTKVLEGCGHKRATVQGFRHLGTKNERQYDGVGRSQPKNERQYNAFGASMPKMSDSTKALEDRLQKRRTVEWFRMIDTKKDRQCKVLWQTTAKNERQYKGFDTKALKTSDRATVSGDRTQKTTNSTMLLQHRYQKRVTVQGFGRSTPKTMDSTSVLASCGQKRATVQRFRHKGIKFE